MDAMRKVQKNHPAALATARKLKEHVLEEFSEAKQKQKFVECMEGKINGSDIVIL